MSLIFQSLQKLDANSEADTSEGADPGFEKDQPRARLSRWLLPIIIGTLLVLALGCGAVYAVQYLKERVPEGRFARQDRHEEDAEASEATQPSPNKITAAPPQKPETPTRPAVATSNEHTDDAQYQYHPPEPEKASAAAVSLPAMKAQTPAEPQVTLAAIPTAPPTGAQSNANDTPSPLQFEEVETTQPAAVDEELEAAQRARRIVLEKSARIARLVHRIEASLAGSAASGDTVTLLNQLARLKGEHHPYVAKLRAYYNFQRGDYILAEVDLKKVIAANPEDFEAGVNLALIEIHGERYPEALARLKKLRQSYPENEKIADLIKRLR